jgi:hypothetical protein
MNIHGKHFIQIIPNPEDLINIKFTADVDSISTFQANLLENERKTMDELFNFDNRYPPFVADGDIVAIKNPRQIMVYYKYVRYPHHEKNSKAAQKNLHKKNPKAAQKNAADNADPNKIKFLTFDISGKPFTIEDSLDFKSKKSSKKSKKSIKKKSIKKKSIKKKSIKKKSIKSV